MASTKAPSGEQVRAQYLASLNNLDRAPFMERAAQFLANAPRDNKIKAWAEKYPDRWAQSVAVFARLSGYTEKTESLNTSLHIAISGLSDGDLLARLDALRSQLTDNKPPALLNITPHTDHASADDLATDNPHTDNQSTD